MRTTAETHQRTITVSLTAEEYDLLEAFAAEQGIEDVETALPAVLHELMRLHDALWDAQFKHLPQSLIDMGNAALEAYEAGQTEEMKPDSP